MKRFLGEYGFVILIVIVITALVATAIVIKARNDSTVTQTYSEFTDRPDAGGKGLDEQLIEDGRNTTNSTKDDPKNNW